jgi:hypothetical protein
VLWGILVYDYRVFVNQGRIMKLSIVLCFLSLSLAGCGSESDNNHGYGYYYDSNSKLIIQ